MNYPYLNSPRCGAKNKYNCSPCRSPAVNGKKRCRMHGGAKGSGAKKGNRNAFKHGRTTYKVKIFRKAIKEILTLAKKSQKIIF